MIGFMPFINTGGVLGRDWEVLSPLGTGALRHVAVNSGLWVLAGPAGNVYRSSNQGSSWSNVAVSTTQHYGMAYGEGLFTVAQDAGNGLWSSPDAVTWTIRINDSRDHHAINYNDGYFALGSGTNGGSGYIYGSAAGTTWITSPSVGSNSVQCGIYVASLGRTFAAGGQYKYAADLPTAVSSWLTPTGLGGTIYQVAWSPDLGVAVCVGTGGIYSSTNLSAWTNRGAIGTMYNVAWCDTQFVAVGSGGKIYTSPDGVTWTNRSIGLADSFYGVAYDNGCILVTGDSGLILRSQ